MQSMLKYATKTVVGGLKWSWILRNISYVYSTLPFGIILFYIILKESNTSSRMQKKDQI